MDLRALPNFPLSPHSSLARGFLQRGISDYHRAVLHVARLRWMNAADTGEYRAVLTRRRGTPAAKHALLATLAAEHGVPAQLILAIYEIDAVNTPAAAEALRRFGVDRVLDCGCWLRYSGERIDLSRKPAIRARVTILHEEVIEPEQIAGYRLTAYQRFLWNWCLPRGWSWVRAWEVRQACLDAQMEQLSACAATYG